MHSTHRHTHTKIALTQHIVLLRLIAASDHPNDATTGQLGQHHAATIALDGAHRAVRIAAPIATISAVLVRIGDVVTEVRSGRHFVADWVSLLTANFLYARFT